MVSEGEPNPDDPESGQPFNPYAAPQAPLDAPAVAVPEHVAAAEVTRRRYLNHETNIKSLGALNVLGGALMLLGGVVVVPMALLQTTQLGAAETAVVAGVAVFYAIFGCVSVALGLGLRRLRPWARWTQVVICSISLLWTAFVIVAVALSGDNVGPLIAGNLVVALIPGVIFYLLVSRKGSVVFSPDYAEVVALTPHVRYKTSCIVKGLLILLLVVIIPGILAGVIGLMIGKR
jgi:hypothetical protein